MLAGHSFSLLLPSVPDLRGLALCHCCVSCCEADGLLSAQWKPEIVDLGREQISVTTFTTGIMTFFKWMIFKY